MFPVNSASRFSRANIWRRVQPFAWAGLTLLAVLVYQARVGREMVDFTVWQKASARAVHAEPLYRQSDGHYQFKYLPAFAVLTAPFGLVDQSRGKALWFASSVVLLISFLRWSLNALPNRRHAHSLLLVFTIMLMGKFYARELLLGQTNLLLGALCVAALLAVQRGRPAAAGALTGLAVFVKPYALVFLPWLLVTQSWRAFAMAAAVIAAGLLAPAALYGWSGNLELLAAWLRTVTESTAPNLLNNDNISIAAMWAKWLGPSALAASLAWGTIISTLVLVLAVLWKRRAVSAPEYLDCALLMLLIPLISPQGWDYVLLLATPAVICVLDRWCELTRPWQWGVAMALVLLGLTMFDIMGRALYGRFMALSVVTVCALAVAVGLLHLRRRALA